MPIDFAAIVAAYRPAIRLQMRPIALIFNNLGRWLRPRFAAVSAIERATQAVPVLRFYNDALTVSMDRSQFGALTPSPPPPPVIIRAGERFLGGLGRIPVMVEQELILPNFLASLADLIGAIADSIDDYVGRADDPARLSQMFDLNRRRTFIELFGQGVLAFRAFGTSAGSVGQFVTDVGSFTRVLSSPRPTPSAPAGPEPSREVAFLGYADTVEGYSRYLVAAFAIFPAAADLLEAIVQAASLSFRVQLLATMQRVERKVFDLRVTVIDLIYEEIPPAINEGARMLEGVRLIISRQINVYFQLAIAYFEQLVVEFEPFFRGLSDFITDLMQTVLSKLFRGFDFDLAPIIRIALRLALAPLPFGSSLVDAMPIPPITLADLADVAGRAALLRLQSAIEGLRLAIAGQLAMTPWPFRRMYQAIYDSVHIRERLAALSTALGIAATFPATPTERLTFTDTGVSFPNLHEMFFGSGSPSLRDAFHQLHSGLTTGVRGIITSGAEALDSLERAFSAAADRAAYAGSLAQLRALARNADDFAEATFGIQARDLRESMAARLPDLHAQAFEDALGGWNFSIFERLIPDFVGGMRRYYAERTRSELQTVPGETPTSPHILARRRLRRVHTPEVLFQAGERRLTRDLVDQIAVEFPAQVSAAYREGLRRFNSERGGG